MQNKISAKLSLVLLSSILATACASTPETVETPIVTQDPGAAERAAAEAAAARAAAEAEAARAAAEAEAARLAQLASNQALDTQVLTGPVPGSTEEFISTTGDRVFFGYDQYSLNQEARNVLRGQAQWLGNYPSVITVIGGHADERGTREYNLALGARRADAIKDFLISQGVDPARVTTVSYGKERPLNAGSNEQSWALNRNGHTVIVSGSNS